MAKVPKRDLGFAMRIFRNVILGVSEVHSIFIDINSIWLIEKLRLELHNCDTVNIDITLQLNTLS